MESFPTDPIYTSIEEFENPFLCQEDFYIGHRNGIGIWDDLNFGFEVETGKEIILYNDNSKEAGESLIREKPKRVREEKSLGSNELTRSTISRYFYMPITQAAKELNIGLTLLKKRCRELGIRRWPHRKLISLQTLIKNVQELGKENRDVSREKLRNAVEILEQERKLMEEMPDLQLEEKTKKLRQACFKANYKKRKLMGMIDLPTSSTTNTWPESYDSLCGEIQTQKRGQSSM
nr:TPA_asm: hypothetical protein HUJ06_010120 [Nelumbo nucifera]